MTDFIINTPSHKRWLLPDKLHELNGIIYGNALHLSIINSQTGLTCISHTIMLENGWKDLADLFQKLAIKKFGGKRAPHLVSSIYRW